MAVAICLTGTVAAVGTEAATPERAQAACAINAPSAAYAGQTDLSVGHARVWRLYQAFFLRQPDADGFDYWLSVRADGATLSDIAFQFASGNEFKNRYGNLSHAQFVDLVYDNVLCRPPDAEGRTYWTGLLSSGSLTRWDMVINFAELREYLRNTETCHSIYPAESAAVSGCPDGSSPAALSSASISADGYRSFSALSGAIQGVEVDFPTALANGAFGAGPERCSVASINGNWLVASQKDSANPGVLGVGLIDGIHVKNSSERSDRGLFGLRFDSNPTNVIETWPGNTVSASDTRLNSVMYSNGTVVLEQWHAAAELSPYLTDLAPNEIVDGDEWVWAAAGIPLIVDGQADADLASDYANDPYTYDTYRHPFVAYDQDSNRLVFGATASRQVRDLVSWATGAGYEDLIKFDGGGSAEFNINGQAVVAGTPRDVPLWLGIGC